MNTPNPIHLMIVDDDELLRESLARRFQQQGMVVVQAGSGEEGLEKAGQARVDVALLDLKWPSGGGIEALDGLKANCPEVEILLLTADANIETAIEAMKRGAYDYLLKPFHFAELEIRIQKAAEKSGLVRRERQRIEQLQHESARHRLIGSSPAMQKVAQLIQKVAATDAAVLVRGDGGTGKELVARTLHANSARRNSPLVTIPCAALPETMLESELFGHEKSAFPGASEARNGLVEVADGGTLFVDEIAEMGIALQAKLLRVLEDGRFRRVGSTQERRADIRLVAATSKSLEAEIKAGRFRDDLFYRINVVTVELPSLRERREDIQELVEHFLQTRPVGPACLGIHPRAVEALIRYDWPGNVRELANVLERAQILAEDQWVTLDDLPENLAESEPDAGDAGNPRYLREVERRHVQEVLRDLKGNKAHTAKALGIGRRALYRLIAKYHLDDRQRRDQANDK